MDGSTPAPNIGRGVLQAIFAVFLGLMITAVVGVGVYTFHPNPGEESLEQIQMLQDERSAIDGCGSPTPGQCREWDQLTPAEQARTKAIDAETTALQAAYEQRSSQWRMSTSVILIVIATLLMAVALALGDSVAVLSNGILLGGLFTMLYGVGWGLASGNSVTRFVVLLVALGVSLALGYVKFVRGRRPSGAGEVPGSAAPAVAPTGAGPSPDVAELSSRVEALERRLAAAAQGLRGEEDPATGRGAS
ncbi:MAG: hypothetical protein MUF09_03740 [Candidatus Nanopelagicales bacterium]|jgi:hypothetical protein|nr:hypothetical protein [Candidatus Nanopelagicales bacterium]